MSVRLRKGSQWGRRRTCRQSRRPATWPSWGRLVTGLAAALAVGLAAVGVLAWQSETARRTSAREQAQTAQERDGAVRQKRRTREALDTMISKEMIERLGTQKQLSDGQKQFMQ